MKNYVLLFFVNVMLLSGCDIFSDSAKGSSKAKQLSIDNGKLRIQFWSDDVVRITYAAAKELLELNTLSIVETPAAVHRN